MDGETFVKIFGAVLMAITTFGLGLTVTWADFVALGKKPRAMIVAPLCQFVVLPFTAWLLGLATGWPQSHPYHYAGLVLIAACPGGVMSNLLTHLAKGDVALSMSMTALSTVLSVILTPLVVGFYTSDLPEFTMPIGDVMGQIFALVLLPFSLGMTVRRFAENFARRAEPIFVKLGLFALVFLIVGGVLKNLDRFSDTENFGALFYFTVFCVSFGAMLFSTALGRLIGVPNRQTRAIVMETGLQNAILGIAISLMLQDKVGDTNRAMFFTSAMFGLLQYPAAGIAFWVIFPKLLPVHAGRDG